jgi:hypothetical protein
MIVRGLVALAAAFVVSGCLYVGGSAGSGPRIPADARALIIPGRTTKAEVLERLGPPREYQLPALSAAMLDDRLRLSGALSAANIALDVFTYQFDQLDIGGTVLILFNYFDVEARSDQLVVFFDHQDVVIDVSLRVDGEVR